MKIKWEECIKEKETKETEIKRRKKGIEIKRNSKSTEKKERERIKF